MLPLDLELGVLDRITRTDLPLSSTYAQAIAV